ncbi:hypothetical protein PIB30_030089 [Stylosanthes scabra]|uniref:F-box associated domain-containing protein n=1 Tax=Stylosanthes scabra TaxID=79078 RepID=A0ABU6WB71_9FABA|nr:hypothetical protein [Stylosanthes scabra]
MTLQSHEQRSILIHATFPRWRGQTDSLICLEPENRRRRFSTLPPSLIPSEGFELIGTENGIICINHKSSDYKPKTLIWNMPTGDEKRISYPAHVAFSSKVLMYAFAYNSKSYNYSIFHAFQKNIQDKLWGYTVYSSVKQEWSEVVACRGSLSNIGPEFCTNNGIIYWIKYVSAGSNVPESLVAYSVISDEFNNYIIPHTHRNGSHSLVKMDDTIMCLAICREGNGKKHTVTFWSIMDANDGTYKMKSVYQINDLQRYNHLKFFIDDDLFCLVDETRTSREELTSIFLSKINDMKPHGRHYIHCGTWNHPVQVRQRKSRMSSGCAWMLDDAKGIARMHLAWRPDRLRSGLDDWSSGKYERWSSSASSGSVELGYDNRPCELILACRNRHSSCAFA